MAVIAGVLGGEAASEAAAAAYTRAGTAEAVEAEAASKGSGWAEAAEDESGEESEESGEEPVPAALPTTWPLPMPPGVAAELRRRYLSQAYAERVLLSAAAALHILLVRATRCRPVDGGAGAAGCCVRVGPASRPAHLLRRWPRLAEQPCGRLWSQGLGPSGGTAGWRSNQHADAVRGAVGSACVASVGCCGERLPLLLPPPHRCS